MNGKKYSISALGELAYQIRKNDPALKTTFLNFLNKEAHFISRQSHSAAMANVYEDDRTELAYTDKDVLFPTAVDVLINLSTQIDPDRGFAALVSDMIGGYASAKDAVAVFDREGFVYKTKHLRKYRKALKKMKDFNLEFTLQELVNVVAAKVGPDFMDDRLKNLK